MTYTAYESKYTGAQIEAMLDEVNSGNSKASIGSNGHLFIGQTDTGISASNSGSSGSDINVYCYKKCLLDSNPNTRIYYDGINQSYHPCGMDWVTGTFNPGSWQFLIDKFHPCMVKYDGTVDYELDKNDYSKKLDGSDSDINNTSYEGNAMMAVPLIYKKKEQIGFWEYNYFTLDENLTDETWQHYAHTDSHGNKIPYCFMPIYNGSNIASKLRSMSGQTCINTQTGTTEITYAINNNVSGSVIWDTEVFADRQLINDLLILMAKTTNTQTAYGYGHYTGGQNASSLLKTGTMNNKGMFWGSRGTGVGVKVFGMENWWGNIWRRIRGYINDKGTIKVKLTYDTSDGSTVYSYNTDGTGYITIAGITPQGTSGGYISETYANNYGTFPYISSGTQDTFDTDGFWYNNSQVDYAFVGGACNVGFLVGASAVALNGAVSLSSWDVGASVSCKPDKDSQDNDEIIQGWINN